MIGPEMDNFVKTSYKSHATHYNSRIENGELGPHAKSWLRRDTVDSWRHARMRDFTKIFVQCSPHAKWLTVGDGRLGLDAAYLKDLGADALATDLSDDLLKIGKKIGLIDHYSIENTEFLTFADNSFDYTLCKESYHHFPRPFLALSEMLRVTRRAVLMVEPQDPAVGLTILQQAFLSFESLVKRTLGKTVEKHQFEDSGNYVYTISKREIEKAALGVGLRHVAFRDRNDFYCVGVEHAQAVPANRLYKKVKRRIFLADMLTKLGLKPGFLLEAIVFKEAPSAQLRGQLALEGFDVRELPENPYLKI